MYAILSFFCCCCCKIHSLDILFICAVEPSWTPLCEPILPINMPFFQLHSLTQHMLWKPLFLLLFIRSRLIFLISSLSSIQFALLNGFLWTRLHYIVINRNSNTIIAPNLIRENSIKSPHRLDNAQQNIFFFY